MTSARTEPAAAGARAGRAALRAPATRDQVDAYRFGLRRLESALVRGDAVPLHEQVRAQRRAAGAGLFLGLLAVAVVAALALVSPRPDWTRQAVVVGRESGAMYVVARGPDRLVPVANLVAARLVLGALQRGGSAGGDPATAVPVVVPDEALAAAPRTAGSGVPGAEAVRPDAPGIPPRWAVCDEVESGGSGRVRLVGTTVAAGAAEPGTGGAPVLLRVPDGSTWLVAGGRRHRVDTEDPLVLATLGLRGAVPRPASGALVSAVPEAVPLARPVIPGLGGAGPAGLRARVGEVLVVRLPDGATRPHVVLADGIQPVPVGFAELLRAAASEGDAAGAREVDAGAGPGEVVTGAGPRVVDAAEVARVPVVERLAVQDWPSVPELAGIAEAPVVCWTWPGDDVGAGVTTGRAVPVSPGARTVALAQADAAGPRLDVVVLGAGGGPVRSVVPGGAPDGGGLFLVSETGVAYGVAPGGTAQVLGVGDAPPAPEALVRLLPVGAALDVAAAGELVDVPGPTGG